MEIQRSKTRLILRPDADAIEWLRIQNRMGVETTLQDLPNHLRSRMNSLALTLFALASNDRGIQTFEFDASRAEPARVNGLPFDLRLMPQVEDIEEILFLVDWWMYFEQRRNRCRGTHSKPKRPDQPIHLVWTCECGQEVLFAEESILCNNAKCPSWSTWRACTDKKLPGSTIGNVRKIS